MLSEPQHRDSNWKQFNKSNLLALSGLALGGGHIHQGACTQERRQGLGRQRRRGHRRKSRQLRGRSGALHQAAAAGRRKGGRLHQQLT